MLFSLGIKVILELVFFVFISEMRPGRQERSAARRLRERRVEVQSVSYLTTFLTTHACDIPDSVAVSRVTDDA